MNTTSNSMVKGCLCFIFCLLTLIVAIKGANGSLLSDIKIGNDPLNNYTHGSTSEDYKPDFNFAAVGDWGCTGATMATVRNIEQHNPDFVLGLGDYAYLRNPDCWLKIAGPIIDKMKLVIGNHDHLFYKGNFTYVDNPRLQVYLNRFNISNQFYSFNYKSTHFLAMSTEIPYNVSSAQYAFVVSDLAKAHSDPNIRWIIVFYHRIAYTSPSTIGSLPDWRDMYHPLFVKYGVDLVIQAHDHQYQRTYPIKYNTTFPSKPFVTDRNMTLYHNPDGQVFLIVGTGGSPIIHNFTGSPAPFTAKQFNARGFLNVEIGRTKVGENLTGTFYGNNGTVSDRFMILKDIPPSKVKHIESATGKSQGPRLASKYQDRFTITPILSGLKSPTGMAFLAENDILVIEKNNGTVRRIINGNMLQLPLLDVNVANKVERGMLGIATSRSNASKLHIFLYYTESLKDGSDVCPKPNYCNPRTDPLANRLYKYDLATNGTKLINPKLLLSLPATPGPGHNGGKILIGPDKNVYTIIGDLMGHKTQAENYKNGEIPDGTGGILMLDQEGAPLVKSPLGKTPPLNLYYAYGIRNSFGMDFDPVSGILWDTENGPDFGDEINLVEPGFNSGWKFVQGIWTQSGGKPTGMAQNLSNNLVNFEGKGRYRSPEFIWNETVGPTALKFLKSDKMGIDFAHDLFVADANHGSIYRFKLNANRTGLMLEGALSDRIANNFEELQPQVFATGFGPISDLQTGPDGYLYVLSLTKGTIYKISPRPQ